MNKKSIKKYLIMILLVIEVISLTLTYKSYENRLIDEVKEVHELDNNAFSMYVENDEGNYEEYTESELFPEGYNLNLEKSGCIDEDGNILEGILKSNGNKVIIMSKKTTYCYLYFDMPDSSITVNVSTDGVSKTLPTTGGYKATLTCDGATSSYSNKYQRIEITNVGNTSTTCNLNYTKDTNTYTLLKTEVESKATSGIDGYRYTGKEPDNWVWFNNEMWRIIGSIPTCTDATIEEGATSGTCNQAEGDKPRLVKIIRAESIGGLAYHSELSSIDTTWGSGNTLYTLLNEYYYGKKNTTGANPCFGYSNSVYGLCNYTKIGLSNSEEDYYGRMIESVYMNGGTVSSNSKTIDASYDLEAGLVTKETKIGLMTISDYGYATSGITYSGISLSWLNSYTNNNWLISQGIEWTMTSHSAGNVMYVNNNGYVSKNGASLGYAIRPVVYLDSSVYIISGSGTILDPYIIGM